MVNLCPIYIALLALSSKSVKSIFPLVMALKIISTVTLQKWKISNSNQVLSKVKMMTCQKFGPAVTISGCK